MKVLVAVPAYNEASIIQETAFALHHFLAREMSVRDWRIIIAENGSDDGTGQAAAAVAQELPRVRHMTVASRGKGNAIREAWLSERADVYAFMDADLATDLSALPRLVSAIARGADIAIGSRHHRDSTVERTAFRFAMSHGYRFALRTLFGTTIGDAPCGFKAVNQRVVDSILPVIRDDEWFFDTELLLRAERAGMRIEEIPVIWRERHGSGRVSKVAPIAVAAAYLGKMARLRAEI